MVGNITRKRRVDHICKIFADESMQILLEEFASIKQFKLHTNHKFLQNILGAEVLEGTKTINMADIKFRLQCAGKKLCLSPTQFHARNSEIGSAWIDYSLLGKLDSIITIEKGWTAHLKQISETNFLDLFADVKIPGYENDAEEEDETTKIHGVVQGSSLKTTAICVLVRTKDKPYYSN